MAEPSKNSKEESMDPTESSSSVSEEEQTITSKLESVSLKHPLQHRWVLWYDNPKKKQADESWEDNLKCIYTFDTVEDFWSLYNNILEPTKLITGSNYHLFKEGVRPMWEDAANEKGGKWIHTSAKQRRNKLDDAWMYTVLSMIGETMNDEDDICGAVISVRRSHDRIALWTRTATNEKLQKSIGRSLRQAMELGRNCVLKYQSHADAAASGSSFQNKVHYEA